MIHNPDDDWCVCGRYEPPGTICPCKHPVDYPGAKSIRDFKVPRRLLDETVAFLRLRAQRRAADGY